MYKLIGSDDVSTIADASEGATIATCGCQGGIVVDEKGKHGLVCTCHGCGKLSFWHRVNVVVEVEQPEAVGLLTAGGRKDAVACA
jgi:hypothetical protein